MRESGASGLLVRRSDVVPDVDGYERHAVVFVKNHRQTVRQREHLVRNGDGLGTLLGRDRRGRETSRDAKGNYEMSKRHDVIGLRRTPGRRLNSVNSVES